MRSVDLSAVEIVSRHLAQTIKCFSTKVSSSVAKCPSRNAANTSVVGHRKEMSSGSFPGIMCRKQSGRARIHLIDGIQA